MLLETLSRAVQHDWLMRLVNPAFGAFNPFLASYRRDPYPTYKRLRELRPRYRHSLLQSWIFSKHADVTELLTHPQMSVNRVDSDMFKRFKPFKGGGERLKSTLFKSLLMIDPPNHTRIRGLVNKAFAPNAIGRLGVRIEAFVDVHLKRIRPGEPFDLLNGFAVPLPLTVICELLGVPDDRLGDLKRWSALLTQLLDPVSMVGVLRRSSAVLAELAEYFDSLFTKIRRSPGDDLLSSLVQAEEAGERLDNDELVSLVALLLAAGHETTTNLLANSVLALEDQPELRERLVQEPEIAGTAVDELLRFDSPIQITDRVAKADVELGQAVIRRGEMAVLLLGSANRDRAAFTDPDELDFERSEGRHLSFGHGIHFCVGAALARLEGKLALPGLLRALGNYRVERRGMDWKRSVVLRGPTQLIVTPSR